MQEGQKPAQALTFHFISSFCLNGGLDLSDVKKYLSLLFQNEIGS